MPRNQENLLQLAAKFGKLSRKILKSVPWKNLVLKHMLQYLRCCVRHQKEKANDSRMVTINLL